jgi:ABC-type glycerol-3-phosphate transport system substrate-binding protein
MLNPSVQNDLRFHFPADAEGKITAESVVFAGIPKTSKNVAAAETALKWFFATDNQKKLMALYKSLHIDQFGVAGGFPALKSANESFILDYQPVLSGSFPSADNLAYETAKPLHWKELVEDVFYPWLINPASSSESGDADLKNRLADWYKQSS